MRSPAEHEEGGNHTRHAGTSLRPRTYGVALVPARGLTRRPQRGDCSDALRFAEPKSLAPAPLLALLAACGAVQGPTVTAVAPAPGAVIASVPIGRGPTLLAISPDGSVVYAAAVGSLFAIRTDTNTVAASASIDPYTTGIAVTRDGGRILLGAVQSSSLEVLPASNLTQTSRIGLPQPGLYPGGYSQIRVSADGRTAWLVNEDLYLAIVDLAAGTSSELTLDMRPNDVGLSRDGRTVYVLGCKAYCTTGTIEVIDVASQNVTATIDVGPGPYRFALSPDGRRGYSTNLGGPSLSIVDLAGRTVRATLPVGIEPTGLAVAPDGARVYVSSNRTGALTVASGDGEAVLVTVQVPGAARDLVVSPDGRRAYVSTSAPNAVVVLDTTRLGAGRRRE
jgi:YVTN family beta-propeller protein